MKKQIIAVIGAGSGGQCMAAHFAMEGYPVRLQDIDEGKIAALKAAGAIKLSGALGGEGRPALVTSDAGEAVRGADIIMVVTTTDAHHAVAKAIAPFVTPEQIIVLSPGHAGGCLEMMNVLSACGVLKLPPVGECPTLIYGCRQNAPGDIFVTGVKKSASIASIPPENAAKIVEALGGFYPQLKAAPNVLSSTLSGTGCLLHVIPTVMSANKIDAGVSFDFYMEGITESVAELIERADSERLAVAAAMGAAPKSLRTWLKDAYSLREDTLYNMLQANKSYVGTKSPKNYSHRFVVEDIACGFVPISSFGKAFGVPTPVVDAFILLGSILCGTDYMKTGRSVDNLGLAGKTPEEIIALLT